MDIDSSSIFAPIVINGHTVKNRLSVAPMTRITATQDGRATETMTRYYERFARGGFGTVITEGIYTDQAFSQGYVHQPGMTDEVQANAWKPVVSGIKAHGALAIAQIMHAGAISQGNRFRDTTVGPSAVQPKGEQMTFYHGKGRYALPVAMTEAQIADAITGFAESAGRAIEVAGFDAIEIHGANGYLLDQFLTDYANNRVGSVGRLHGEPRAIDPRDLQGGACEGRRQGAGRRPHLSREGERLPSQVGRCGARCGNHLRQPGGRRRRLHPCDRI